MTRTIFLLLAIAISSKTQASTQVFFTDQKASIVLQGEAGDMDAPKLFDSMKVEAVLNGTSISKHIKFTNSAKQDLFDLSCTLSKTVANLGSCTLNIFKVDGMVFEPNTKRVIVAVQDIEDISKVSQLFVRPDQYGHVYFSADIHMGITLHYTGSYPDLFMIQYSAN